MDNTATGLRRQDDDTPHFPSPPTVMSNSTNVSQSGSQRAPTASGPTLQGKPSYATMARKAISDERLQGAAGAASRREPTNNPSSAHPAAASRDCQATTAQFNIELDARSRAGKPPLDADNTQYVSASNVSPPKETRASQRDGITNSRAVVSVNSMQQPVHPLTNSPPSRNMLPSQASRDNSSNISLPVVAPGPGPEEMRKRDKPPHPQEDSRNQRTVIKPSAEKVGRTASIQPPVKPSTSPLSFNERKVNGIHADSEQVDYTSSIQPSAKPSISSSPPFSSGERNVTRPHANPVHRTASSSVQPPIKPSTPPSSSTDRNTTRPHADPVNGTDSSPTSSIKSSTPYPPPSSSNERNATIPHADSVKRTASSSVQSSIKPSSPYHPPLSSSERYTTIPHADPVKPTASSFVQPSFKPSTPYSPPSSSTERNATRAHADPVNPTVTSSVQPTIKPSTPYSPPFSSSETSTARLHAEPVGRTASVQPPAKPSTSSPPMGRPSASMSPSRPAPVLAKMVSNRMHPVVDRGSTRSDELARNDPSAASPRPPAPPEPTKPPLQDHTSVVPPGPPLSPKHIPTTTGLPSQQDRKVPSVTPARPPVRPEHTPETTVSRSLPEPKDAPTASSTCRPPVLLKHTPAMTDPPLNSLSRLVSGRGDLDGNKSSIKRNEPDGVNRGTERTIEVSHPVREERNRILVPERDSENRLKDSADVKPKPPTGGDQDILQHPTTASQISLQQIYPSYRTRGYDANSSYLPNRNASQREVGQSLGSAEHPATTTLSESKHLPQLSKTSLTYVYMGAVGLQRDPSTGSSLSEEGDEPVLVPHQDVPSSKGETLVGITSGSPPDPDAGKSRDPEKSFGSAMNARPPFTSISPLNEGNAQQRTGSRDTEKGSSQRVQLENPRNPTSSVQSQRTGVISPPLYLKKDRDDDGKPLLRQTSSRTGNSGDRPSTAEERDKQPHFGAAHSLASPSPSPRSPPSRPAVGAPTDESEPGCCSSCIIC